MRDAPAPSGTILFVCLHGSAKSLIAAEYFNRLASERGIAFRGESSGIEPDAQVPEPVVAGLGANGLDVRDYVPRLLDAKQLGAATRVVSFGCALPDAGAPARHVEEWNDLPLVSDGFGPARDAIVARVTQLVDGLASAGPR